ncbi:hypothetical protein J5N97_011736 [Dioscorea zingiberensis]|uniref:Uncharacterized protein n=1 Tax=Dioscorea zingiberensis TaxID=325984 RepID=A0A9D5D115_9LILI|nr:hypothetical protein J5N97_011736 [Dioscorea zingiberensis]
MLIVVSLLALICTGSISTDILSPNQSLHDGQTLVSAGGTFALGFFSPGGSKNRYVGIWYNKLQVQTVVWVANRRSPLSDTNGTLELSGNGTLTINSMSFLPMPSLMNLTNPLAQLLDDGNLVVRESNSSEFVWQSFDYPTDTLLQGMKLGWDLRIGLNRNLTSWRTKDDPSPGSYILSMDLQGPGPQLTLWFGSAKKWVSGPLFDVSGFTNTPELSTLNGFTNWYNISRDEVYYMFGTGNPKSLSRWTANQFGKVERLLWNESISMWNLVLNLPKSQCDEYSPCGPYGLCDLNSSPVCSCLQGFRPKSQQEWDQRDASSGCVRVTALDCKNRIDGFMNVTHASLPDTALATFHDTISLDQCRQKCLTNCSCTGYASADIYGSGCVIWVSELVGVGTVSYGGRDVYVRLASADLAFIAHHQLEKDIRGDDELELPQLQWSTVMAATRNFAAENILGKGGFGPVYKGKLEGGKEIAVKRLSRNSTQGVDEFKNEVILIAKLQHRNLVRLLGYCIQGEERMLIYEYMPNGSLDAFLFDKEKGVHLDWQARWRIIVGIARGLIYVSSPRLKIQDHPQGSQGQ